MDFSNQNDQNQTNNVDVTPSPPVPTEPAFPPVPPMPVAPVEPMTPPPATDPVMPPPTPVEPMTPPASTPPATSTSGSSIFEGKGKGKYRVVVLKDKCIGAASCVAVSPKTYQLNDQQIAEILPTVIDETDENLLLSAQSCPTLAIEVYDTETDEKVWPK